MRKEFEKTKVKILISIIKIIALYFMYIYYVI